MPQITLDAIQREATALEIDMQIVDGFLEMSKRGDASLFYHSLHQINDSRVLPDAWQWLQIYRTNLQRIDEVRAQLAADQQVSQVGGQVALVQARAQLAKQSIGGKPVRQGNIFAAEPLFVAHCFLALALGGIIGLLTGKFLIGVGAILPLIVVVFVVRGLSRRRKPKQS